MRFGLKLRVWPKKRGPPKAAVTKQQNSTFKTMVALVNQVPAWDRVAATTLAHGTGWTWRDVLSKCVTGTFWEIPGLEQAAVPFIFDVLSNVEGAILYRGPDGWVGLAPGADGEVIMYVGGLPTIVPPSDLGLGITQLHGDVIAGPGTGDVATALRNSGVVAGTYHHCTLQVDVAGRIIDAAAGEAATATTLGVVKPDNSTITVDSGGTLSVPAISPPIATLATNGISHPDGTTITIDGSGKLTGLAGGGGGTGGLFSGAMSALPTQTSTGLTANAGGGTVTDTIVGMVMTATSTGVWLHKALPTGIKAFAVLLQQTAKSASFSASAIGFSDGSKGVICQLQWTGSNWQLVVNQFSAINTYSSTPYNGPNTEVSTFAWLKIYDDGTNINFMKSSDGFNWVTFYSQGRTSYLSAVSQVVLGSFAGSGPTPCTTLLASYKESAT